MNKEKIVLVGGGGHCRSVIDVIEALECYTIHGIIDTVENIGKDVLGYPVIGCDNDLETIFENCPNAVVTIGHIHSNSLRVKLFDHLTSIGYTLPAIISPLAYVSKHATLGEGTIVMHHALINANAKVGKNCIINTKALLEHDTIIGDHCHISTASVLNGGVRVENDSFYGSNAVSKQNIQISGFIKAGSVVK